MNQPAAAGPDIDAPATLASAVYQKLRYEIIVGLRQPGSRLNIKALCDEFGSALSPVREALNRLAPEGMVVQIDNRGFIVAPVSIADCADLTMARCWVNEIALRDAIAHGGPDWEERVIVALHRLGRTPHGEMDEEQQRIWSDVHGGFHATLISACRSAHIRKYCDNLFHSAERYRHIARRTGERRDEKDGHADIAQAAIDRDVERAVDLLNRHFRRTAELVERALSRRG